MGLISGDIFSDLRCKPPPPQGEDKVVWCKAKGCGVRRRVCDVKQGAVSKERVGELWKGWKDGKVSALLLFYACAWA